MSRPEVERTTDIRFDRVRGINLKLDVYRHRSHPDGCPTLLQIHGGGWSIGDKREQALPLMYQLAAHGWVCVSTNYRLSPHATFPEHLIDVKKAIKWIREHGAEYGANPDFIVVTGGSAGGHLAALVALTANDPEYQPGFEQVDTTVQAAVPLYGVYDFTDRWGLWPNRGLARILETAIMKGSIEELPEEYHRASPIDRIGPSAPPFFIIHGSNDTLVPVEEARRFARELRKVSASPVVYAEIPRAQHAFELLPSLHTQAVVDAIERFGGAVYGAAAGGKSAEEGRATQPVLRAVAGRTAAEPRAAVTEG
ncbi:MAG: alpha/beta hydrolase [Deltaproteobacteria bacterium]|nr:MAG: alpha/beta hydrolase [Deltaproteobacteria bacterium]